MASLMVAVFTVSTGFGMTLPLLPDLIERVADSAAPASAVARHTGLLTATYTMAIFLFAPIWGRLSDRIGRRTVMLTGLAGFAATAIAGALTSTLSTIYAERFFAGAFAAAVTPLAPAAVSDLAAPEQARARALAFVNMAGMGGFLLGPMLGPGISRIATGVLAPGWEGTMPRIVLLFAALLAILACTAVALAVPAERTARRRGDESSRPARGDATSVNRLLVLAFMVAGAVAIFEVGFVLIGRQKLALSAGEIALMFTECSLVMFAVQAIVFAPRFDPRTTRLLIPPALVMMAAAIFLLPRASDFGLMLVVIAVVSASAGLLSPILTYWISVSAGRARGWELGRQSAAASLGATLGSAGGGVLFDWVPLPNAPFVLVAGLLTIGFMLSIRLPRLLGRSNQPAGRPPTIPRP